MLYNLANKQLQDLVHLLKNIDEKYYSVPMEKAFESTIGKHTRHIIEFYQLFLEAYNNGNLNYDHRERNTEFETHKFVALKELEAIMNNLNNITENKDLILKSHINGIDYKFPTSVHRELLYLVEHTTHHLALMRIGVSNLKENIILPESLGMAYSTLNNKNG